MTLNVILSQGQGQDQRQSQDQGQGQGVTMIFLNTMKTSTMTETVETRQTYALRETQHQDAISTHSVSRVRMKWDARENT